MIDHSVNVDYHGRPDALQRNMALEYERNGERYRFVKWAQQTYENISVIPPGMGILHQVNVEHIARVVWSDTVDGRRRAYPDTMLGMDSHTPMINALSIFGWGVGGLEAGAAMLGQAVSMLIPNVVGVRVVGRLPEGTTTTDAVLTVTERLRAHGVVGKFVEYFGTGLDHLALTDRATLSNMSPEYGATMGFFPIDDRTLEFLETTGRDPDQVELVEAYAKEQGLWREAEEPVFTETVEIDLSDVEPCLAGSISPQPTDTFGAGSKELSRRNDRNGTNGKGRCCGGRTKNCGMAPSSSRRLQVARIPRTRRLCWAPVFWRGMRCAVACAANHG